MAVSQVFVQIVHMFSYLGQGERERERASESVREKEGSE